MPVGSREYSDSEEGHQNNVVKKVIETKLLRRKRWPMQANCSTQKSLKAVLNVVISGPLIMRNHTEHGCQDRSQIKGSC